MTSDGVVMAVYGIGAFGFLVLGIFYTVQLILDLYRRSKRGRRNLVTMLMKAMVFVNFIYSMATLLRLGAYERDDGAVVDAGRWLVHALSFGLISAAVCTALQHRNRWLLAATALSVSTFFINYLTSREANVMGRLLLWLTSWVPLIYAFVVVAYCRRSKTTVSYLIVFVTILLTWIAYPILLLLGPAMYEWISYNSETLLQGIVDWFSKALFSLFLVLTVNDCYPPTEDTPAERRAEKHAVYEDDYEDF